MKGKFKNWLDTPITWRTYFKTSLQTMVAYCILAGGVYGFFVLKEKLDDRWCEKEQERIRLKKLERECEEEFTEEDEA